MLGCAILDLTPSLLAQIQARGYSAKYRSLSSQESSPSAPEAFLAFEPGFNLFAYPSAVPAEHGDCQGLAEALGGFADGIVSISRLDRASGAFEQCNAEGGNFAVVDGEGYLIEASIELDQVWPWNAACPLGTLAPGVQLVGHPAAPSTLTCFAWIEAQEPGLVSAIQRFNNNTGRFESCAVTELKGGGWRATGVDFPIRAGQGYLFHANRGGPLVLPGCP